MPDLNEVIKDLVQEEVRKQIEQKKLELSKSDMNYIIGGIKDLVHKECAEIVKTHIKDIGKHLTEMFDAPDIDNDK